MKIKLCLGVVLLAALAALAWQARPAPTAPASATAPGARKILYYQSSMHPWIKSDRPGKCPICGMDLVPVYETDADPSPAGGLRLKPESVSALNVTSVAVARQPIARTLRVSGLLTSTSPSNAWFDFDAGERDRVWLPPGRSVEISVAGLPGKTFAAQILPANTAASNAPAVTSARLRAEINIVTRSAGDPNRQLAMNGPYAEATLRSTTPAVLAVPRAAVLSPGPQSIVYLDQGGGRYQRRPVRLGRIGDDFAEVLAGLHDGEKVVTTGSLLIDAEIQISQSASH